MDKIYRGQLDSKKMRRSWFYNVCWEAAGEVVLLGAIWLFIILMFAIPEGN